VNTYDAKQTEFEYYVDGERGNPERVRSLMIDSNTQKQIVLQFSDCINSRDIDGLAALITDDHRFIDSANSSWLGKESALKAWRGFFESYPDYRNVFENVNVRDGVVIIVGHSVCSDKRLDGPALWTAKVLDGKVAEWRVYDDTPENRAQLGV
jgi:ketosteroid isomerase-like protein